MRDTSAFSGLGSYQPSTYELSGVGDPVADRRGSPHGKYVSGSWSVAPDGPHLYPRGRRFAALPVTVLSYQMWHSRFHGELHILGQKILLDRKPYEIIGVMPRDFEFPLVPGRLNRS